jgi:hypothetical protein
MTGVPAPQISISGTVAAPAAEATSTRTAEVAHGVAAARSLQPGASSDVRTLSSPGTAIQDSPFAQETDSVASGRPNTRRLATICGWSRSKISVNPPLAEKLVCVSRSITAEGSPVPGVPVNRTRSGVSLTGMSLVTPGAGATSSAGASRTVSDGGTPEPIAIVATRTRNTHTVMRRFCCVMADPL